jgi:hypothetical protein
LLGSHHRENRDPGKGALNELQEIQNLSVFKAKIEKNRFRRIDEHRLHGGVSRLRNSNLEFIRLKQEL